MWDALTGLHRCQHDNAGSTAVIFTLILPLQDSNIHLFISSHFLISFLSQVSHIKLVAGRVIVARLDGQLDFLELVGRSYLSPTSA